MLEIQGNKERQNRFMWDQGEPSEELAFTVLWGRGRALWLSGAGLVQAEGAGREKHSSQVDVCLSDFSLGIC